MIKYKFADDLAQIICRFVFDAGYLATIAVDNDTCQIDLHITKVLGQHGPLVRKSGI